MNIPAHNRKAIAVLAALFAVTLTPSPYTLTPVFGARVESVYFSDVNGGLSYGAKYSYSSSFEHNGNAQETAVSTAAAGAFSARSGLLAFYPQPSPINDLALVTISSYSLRITWTAPVANWYRNTGAVEKYILHYTSAAYISTDAAFSSARDVPQGWTPLAIGVRDTRIIEGFDAGTTYYFAIESVNDHLLQSELSNMACVFAVVPLVPMNFRVTANPTSVTMSWIPPIGFANLMPFNDRFNPVYPYEISGYQVFRATAPANADWLPLGPESGLSTDTFHWTDNTVDAGRQYYYHVKALNKAGFSAPSYTQGNTGAALYFIAADNTTLLEIPGDGLGDFVSDTPNPDPMNLYTVEIIPHPEDLGGRVLRSVELSAYRGGIEKDGQFKLSSPATLKVYYRKSGGVVVPSGEDAAALSLYYYNGAKWLQFYGKVNETDKNVELQTTMLGKYQLRSVVRSVSFSADAAGLSNRLITPNSDGKNDNMVFVFDKSLLSGVKGRIYDMKGAYVAKMTAGPITNSLVWDAKRGGQIVPGGVYIYQIESGGKVYNGTVAVIR